MICLQVVNYSSPFIGDLTFPFSPITKKLILQGKSKNAPYWYGSVCILNKIRFCNLSFKTIRLMDGLTTITKINLSNNLRLSEKKWHSIITKNHVTNLAVNERPNNLATVSYQKPVYNSTAIYWTENHPIDGCSSYEWKASIYWYSATTEVRMQSFPKVP